ncbi:hypothetical protein THAOC_15182, partial [Thalassiosira oceanica]
MSLLKKEEGRARTGTDGNGLGSLEHHRVPGSRGPGAHGRLVSGRVARGEKEVPGSLSFPNTIIDLAFQESTEVSSEASAMSAEHAGKRQRGGRDGLTAVAINSAETSVTSSVDLESMLKQALARIDSLERQHEEMKTSTGRETKALRDDIETLKSINEALEWSLDRLASKVQEGWEYPVTIQPDEYWHNKGYDDEAIVDLKNDFLGKLETTVSELEHGVCDSITVRYVNHDEDLMPHWNA